MTPQEPDLAWFAEPPRPDNTWARRGEQPFDWLSRSTLPRAVAMRAFLNRNLAPLPDGFQATLIAGLRSRWMSAFFELIVARTLQLLGASIIVEPTGQNGKRIDFVATFPTGNVAVEAVSPVIDGHIGEEIKARNALLDVVEVLVPDGWSVSVEELPDLGPNDSKRVFRKSLSHLFEALSSAETDRIHLDDETASGPIRLTAWRKRYGDSPILFEPGFGLGNDTERHIRKAIKGKKQQGRYDNGPSLLAIHVGGLTSRFEDFDKALFGRTTEFVSRDGRSQQVSFAPDGLFASMRREPPVFAGVLAFVRVGFLPFSQPVLYLNPRAEKTLPEELLRLEQRILAPERRSIDVIPASEDGLLSGLGSLTDDV